MIIDTKLDLFKYGTPKVITKNLKRILEAPRSCLQRITSRRLLEILQLWRRRLGEWVVLLFLLLTLTQRKTNDT